MLARSAAALAALAFGFLLLAVFEAGLRLTGVGSELPRNDPFAGFSRTVPMFESVLGANGSAVFRLAPSRAPRADRRLAAEPQREFAAEKAPGTKRVFVIGGSSAAGVPYPTNYAFSAWLERRLEAALPDVEVEVVNAALSGYASRRLLPIVREIAAYEPDLLILYMGHNEWAERQYYAHLIDLDPRLFALWEWTTSLRVYRLISSLLLPAGGESGAPVIETNARQNSQQMFAARKGRAAGHGHLTARDLEYRDLLYRFNLDEMISVATAAGAQVLLVSLSQNFADWPPGASVHEAGLAQSERVAFEEAFAAGQALEQQGDCGGALGEYARAEALDDAYAALQYRTAGCHRALGRFDEARRRYRLASDLDAVPHGAPTAFNDILREVAADRDALFADADAALEAAAEHGLVGDRWMVDFVHPSIAAHQLIAKTIADVLRDADWPEPGWSNDAYRDPDPAELFEAEPRLRERELEVRLFSCELALRDSCVEDLTRRLLLLDPENEVALGSLRRRAK